MSTSGRGEWLPRDALGLLEGWLTIARSVSEVEDAAPGRWVDLRDVGSGAVTRVEEDRGAPRLSPGDHVCARDVDMTDTAVDVRVTAIEPQFIGAWLELLDALPLGDLHEMQLHIGDARDFEGTRAESGGTRDFEGTGTRAETAGTRDFEGTRAESGGW